MRFMKKNIVLMLAVLMTAGILLAPANALVEQSDSYYVADYANVLSPDVEQDIIDANAMLEQSCEGAQIVVVTIDYLPDNYYADEYARQLFNDWHVGPADENNGMLLLLVTEEARGGIVTGDGISHKFTNRISNELLDNYFWNYVDKGQYEKAVTSIFDRLMNWYEDEYDAALTQNMGGSSPAPGGVSADSYLLAMIVLLCVICVVLVIVLNSYTRAVARGRVRGTNHIPMWMLWMMCNDRGPRGPRGPRGGPPPPPPGGFGGFGSSGGFRGGSMGHGGGGFSGGFGGRR